MSMAAQHLDQVIQRLARLEADTGRLIYVCLEPEPGCVLQRSEDVVRFCEDVLWPVSSRSDAQRYLRVCHDICHSAVMFEDQHEVLARYADQGIKVGKVQVSSAVCVDFDALGPDGTAAGETAAGVLCRGSLSAPDFGAFSQWR